MMRFLLLLILCFPIYVFGQETIPVRDTVPSLESLKSISPDSIVIAKRTLIRAGNTIRNQHDTIVRQRQIIGELQTQNDIQSIMIQKQDTELTLLYTRMEISDGILDRYTDLIRKEQWYEKTWLHVAGGFVGALTVSIMVNNIK